MNSIDETEKKGYRVFGNTAGNYRAAKIIENDLIEINNEYSLPFSPKNTRLVFTLGSLQAIISWASNEIKKRKKERK